MALGSLSDLLQTMEMPVALGPQPAVSMPVNVSMPTMAPQPQYAQAQPPHHGGGLGGILGRIGDALLTANGGQPVYANKIQNRQIGDAVASYLGNSDAALAAIFQQDPQAGLALYKMKHPEVAQAPDIVRELQSAGIDPASDQGKQILIQHLNGNGAAEPNFVRELQALGIDPHSPQALELYYGRNSPAGYLLRPPTSSAPVSGLPKVASPDDARKLPPGSHFIMPDGRIGTVPGGATDSAPSPTFR